MSGLERQGSSGPAGGSQHELQLEQNFTAC